MSIKLGGNALAIVAISSTALAQDVRWKALCVRLGEYILASYIGRGRFISKVDALRRHIYPFASEYYTGQALVALVELWKLTGAGRFLDVCEHAAGYLARQNYGVVSQNHWMMYAVERLYNVRPSRELMDYATRLAVQIIDDPRYRRGNRSTPIACRTEALLTFCRLAQSRCSSLAPADVRAALVVIRKNLALQRCQALADGAFLRGGSSAEVRIDYLQHNLMAFLAFYALMTNSITLPAEGS